VKIFPGMTLNISLTLLPYRHTINELDSELPMHDDAIPTITTHQGQQSYPLVPLIDEWVIYHSRKFPFLYVNQGEIIPHHLFFDDPQAFVLLAECAGEKVGLLAAIPMLSPFMDAANYNPFVDISLFTKRGFDPKKILYVAVFFVADDQRSNHQLITALYERAAEIAIDSNFKQMCHFTTIREINHPLKPDPYIPPEPWAELPRPLQPMGITVEFTWPTLQADGSVKNQTNLQELFVVDL
jgi:hypothetical protein